MKKPSSNKRSIYTYKGEIIKVDNTPSKHRIMVGIPMTGLLRSEWVLARYGQVIPCNWGQNDFYQWIDQKTPLGFLVADARNIIVQRFIEGPSEWLLFLDHDVILPPDFILKTNDRMLKGDVPVWGGLYFTKSVPSEPLIYRGRGNSYYTDWKLGDEVWCDGMGLGCHMIHRSILDVLWNDSEWITIGPARCKKIFESPSKAAFDPETLSWHGLSGTEDLIPFYTRIMEDHVFKKAGWPKYDAMKYPYLCDTGIFCRHIDWNGVQYPSMGEETYFLKKGERYPYEKQWEKVVKKAKQKEAK